MFQYKVLVIEGGAVVWVTLDDGAIMGIELGRVGELIATLEAAKAEAALALAAKPMGVEEAERGVRLPTKAEAEFHRKPKHLQYALGDYHHPCPLCEAKSN